MSLFEYIDIGAMSVLFVGNLFLGYLVWRGHKQAKQNAPNYQEELNWRRILNTQAKLVKELANAQAQHAHSYYTTPGEAARNHEYYTQARNEYTRLLAEYAAWRKKTAGPPVILSLVRGKSE